MDLDKQKEINYMLSNRCRLLKIVESIPSNNQNINLLDIGTTPNTFFIKYLNPEFNVFSIDLTNLMADRSRSKGIHFKACDLTKEQIPFENNYFDIVIFTEVLEHLFIPPNKVLMEIFRVLKENGILLFSVPNVAKLANRYKLMLGICPFENANCQLDDDRVHGCGHIREYTMKEITELLSLNRFQIIRCEYLKTRKFIDNYDGLVELPKMLLFIYFLLTFLVPSFRSTLYIECSK